MKTVCLPLRVPTGKFCWEYGAPFVICGNFDNEGGHSTCDLNIGDPKDDLGCARHPLTFLPPFYFSF